MRQTVTSIALALATTVLFWPTPLTAQPSSASSQLEAITVTSTRVNRDLSEIPLSISVVGQREIAENPKPDVSDHVKELPGVQLTTNTYGQHLFSLRGQSSDRTLILIDGVRQRIASSLLAEEAGGIYVDPSEIERIEVLKGPASSLYGSDAIGGVINVVTKKGGDKPLGFSVGLVYDGSTEGVAPKASVYGTRGGFYWRLSGAGFRGADLRMPDGQKLVNSARKQQTCSAKLGYEWEGGAFDFAASRFNGWKRAPAVNGANGRQIDPALLRPHGDRYHYMPDEWRNVVSAKLTLDDLTPVVERLTFLAYFLNEETDINFKFNRMHPTLGTYVAAGSSAVIGVDEANSFGGSIQADLALGQSNKLAVGLDYVRGNAHSAGRYSGFMKNQGLRDEDRRGWSQAAAVFAQDEWSIRPDLALTLGLRYTNTKNSITSDSAYPQRVSSSTHSNVVGSAGLVFSGLSNLSLRALYSQGFRAPTLSARMGKTQRQLPSPGLMPEKSNNFELGARYAAHNLNVDLALFYSILDKPFFDVDSGIPMTSAAGNYTQTRNAKKAKSYGAELAASYDLENLGLTPYLQLTAMIYEREFISGKKSKNTGVPRTWGTAGLKFSRLFAENVRFFSDASLTWAGRHHADNDVGSVLPTLYYRSGWKADVTLGLELGEEHKTTAALSFRNIGDRTFEPRGYFQPGFHVVGSLAYEF